VEFHNVAHERAGGFLKAQLPFKRRAEARFLGQRRASARNQSR